MYCWVCVCLCSRARVRACVHARLCVRVCSRMVSANVSRDQGFFLGSLQLAYEMTKPALPEKVVARSARWLRLFGGQPPLNVLKFDVVCEAGPPHELSQLYWQVYTNFCTSPRTSLKVARFSKRPYSFRSHLSFVFFQDDGTANTHTSCWFLHRMTHQASRLVFLTLVKTAGRASTACKNRDSSALVHSEQQETCVKGRQVCESSLLQIKS